MNPDLLGWLSAALLLLGGFVGLIGAIGVLRLPDCYTRMHSASKAGALGAALVLAGVAAASSGGFALAALFALVVLLATAPLPGKRSLTTISSVSRRRGMRAR